MDWKRIKAEYIAGGTSYRKLAEKYKVSFSTLRKVAAKEQWTELRNIAGAKRDTELADSVGKKEAEKAINIIDVADKLLGKISNLMDDIPLDTQAMKHLTSALKDLKEIKGIKSEADMREQEARINKLRKDAEREDDTTSEVEVVFSAGPGEWNE